MTRLSHKFEEQHRTTDHSHLGRPINLKQLFGKSNVELLCRPGVMPSSCAFSSASSSQVSKTLFWFVSTYRRFVILLLESSRLQQLMCLMMSEEKLYFEWRWKVSFYLIGLV